MKLRFYARGDLLARVPGYAPIVGTLPRYIGRTASVIDGITSHPATKEAFEIDSESQHAPRLAKMARRGDVWCADVATAAHAGAEFAPVRFDSGEWIADSKPAAKAKE